MCELTKKIGKVLTSKSIGTGPSSYGRRIYWASVSQRLRNTVLEDVQSVNTSLYGLWKWCYWRTSWQRS